MWARPTVNIAGFATVSVSCATTFLIHEELMESFFGLESLGLYRLQFSCRNQRHYLSLRVVNLLLYLMNALAVIVDERGELIPFRKDG